MNYLKGKMKYPNTWWKGLFSLATVIFLARAGSAQCTADFTSSAPGCVSKGLDFYAADTLSGTSFSWVFAGGATPAATTVKNPTGVVYSTSGAKSVTLIVSNGTCKDTVTKVVTINDTPSVNFSHVMTVCAGDPVNFTNTSSQGTGITYDWDFGSGASPSSSSAYQPQGITYASSGVKTITLTVSNGNCTVTSISTLTVNATPSASFSSSAPACRNDTVLFSNASTSASSFLWDFDLGASSASPASSNLASPPAVIYSSSGLKTVRLVATLGGCSDTAWQSLQINPRPQSSFTSNAPACGNTGVDFTNTGSSGSNWSYSWDFGQASAPAASSAENPSGVTYTSSGVKTVTLTISNGQCATSAVQNITILSTPSASFSSNAPACENDSVDFTNTGSSGGSWNYSWSFGQGASPSSSTSENPAGITYASFGTKSIRLIVTNGTCSDSSTSTLTINDKPTASFSIPAPTCSNLPSGFTNTGSTGGNWTFAWDFGQGAQPATSSAENPTGITYASSGTKVITLTITDGQCADVAGQNYTILSTPSASFSSNAPACEKDSVSFTNTGTSSAGWNYSWNFGLGASPSASSLENPTGITYTGPGIKSVKLIISDASCSDSASASITVHERPTVSFITSSVPVCAFENVNFANSGSSGSMWSYSWDLGEGAFPTTALSENVSGVTYSTGGVKTISLTISDANCTESFSDTISINELPIADAGRDTIICANRSAQIGTPFIQGHSYTWFPAKTLDDPALAQPTASPEAEFTTYHVKVVRNSTGCKNSDSVLVTMLKPLMANAGIDVAICYGDSIQIGAALIEGQSYRWIPSIGLNDENSPNPMANPDSTTTYTLVVDGAGCDSVTDQVEVKVHPLPKADAGEDQIIALGSSAQLLATGGIMYEWDPASSLSNGGIPNPLASPEETTTYIVEVTNVFNCTAWDTVMISVVEPDLWAPSAFTPNNAGKNDVFYMRGLTSSFNNFEFRIYDEWGTMLFLSRSISNGWDGNKLGDGKPSPQGSYVYQVNAVNSKGEVVNLTGMINLIR